VVDDSRSITAGNFERVKSFLRQIVSRLDIDSGNTRVGLVTFSSTVGTVINLREHSSVASLQSAITSLRYTGGGTDTARALAYVRTTMLTSAAGDRPNVPNIIVVVTDGISVNSHATVVSAVAVDLQRDLSSNSYQLKPFNYRNEQNFQLFTYYSEPYVSYPMKPGLPWTWISMDKSMDISMDISMCGYQT